MYTEFRLEIPRDLDNREYADSDLIVDILYDCGWDQQRTIGSHDPASSRQRYQEQASALMADMPDVPATEISRVIFCGNDGRSSIVVTRDNRRQMTLRLSNTDSLVDLKQITERVIRTIIEYDVPDHRKFRAGAEDGLVYTPNCRSSGTTGPINPRNYSIVIMRGRVIHSPLRETFQKNAIDFLQFMLGIALLLLVGIAQIVSSGNTTFLGDLTEEFLGAGISLLFVSPLLILQSYIKTSGKIQQGSIIVWETADR